MPSRRKSRSRRSRSKVRIPISQPGALTKFGYYDVKHMSVDARHRALRKAMKSKGAKEVSHRLSTLATFQKNANPTLSRKIRADQRYVSRLRSRSR